MYCEKCKVKINNEVKCCPLCHGQVKETGKTEDIFPYIPTIYKRYYYFFRLLIFFCLATSIVSVWINIVNPFKIRWSILVVLGNICLLLLLGLIIKKKINIPKTVLKYVVIFSFLLFLWDYFTGWRGWSINFVIPILCIVGSISMVIIIKIMKLYINEYLIYLVIDSIIGLIPLLFLVFNLVYPRYPTYICIIINVLSLLAIVVFEGESLLSELKRRLHI